MAHSTEEVRVTGRSDDPAGAPAHCLGVVMETSKEEIRRAHRAVPEYVVLDIERHVSPEGAGPAMHERLLPVLMSGMALLGIAIIGVVLGVAGGWRAALLGIGAVLTGCAVAWIVVWGAGVMRAREEQRTSDEVEEHVVDHPARIWRV